MTTTLACSASESAANKVLVQGTPTDLDTTADTTLPSSAFARRTASESQSQSSLAPSGRNWLMSAVESTQSQSQSQSQPQGERALGPAPTAADTTAGNITAEDTTACAGEVGNFSLAYAPSDVIDTQAGVDTQADTGARAGLAGQGEILVPSSSNVVADALGGTSAAAGPTAGGESEDEEEDQLPSPSDPAPPVLEPTQPDGLSSSPPQQSPPPPPLSAPIPSSSSPPSRARSSAKPLALGQAQPPKGRYRSWRNSSIVQATVQEQDRSQSSDDFARAYRAPGDGDYLDRIGVRGGTQDDDEQDDEDDDGSQSPSRAAAGLLIPTQLEADAAASSPPRPRDVLVPSTAEEQIVEASQPYGPPALELEETMPEEVTAPRQEGSWAPTEADPGASGSGHTSFVAGTDDGDASTSAHASASVRSSVPPHRQLKRRAKKTPSPEPEAAPDPEPSHSPSQSSPEAPQLVHARPSPPKRRQVPVVEIPCKRTASPNKTPSAPARSSSHAEVVPDSVGANLNSSGVKGTSSPPSQMRAEASSPIKGGRRGRTSAAASGDEAEAEQGRGKRRRASSRTRRYSGDEEQAAQAQDVAPTDPRLNRSRNAASPSKSRKPPPPLLPEAVAPVQPRTSRRSVAPPAADDGDEEERESSPEPEDPDDDTWRPSTNYDEIPPPPPRFAKTSKATPKSALNTTFPIAAASSGGSRGGRAKGKGKAHEAEEVVQATPQEPPDDDRASPPPDATAADQEMEVDQDDEDPNPTPTGGPSARKAQKRRASALDNAAGPSTSKRPRVSDASVQFSASTSVSRVFAMYSDKQYYPATIIEQRPAGDYCVQFDDGDERNVSVENLRLCELKPGDKVQYYNKGRAELKGTLEVVRVVGPAAAEEGIGLPLGSKVVVAQKKGQAVEVGLDELRIPKTQLSTYKDRILSSSQIHPTPLPRAPSLSPAPAKQESTTPPARTSATPSRRVPAATASPLFRGNGHSTLFREYGFVLSFSTDMDERARLTQRLLDNGGTVASEVTDFFPLDETLVARPSRRIGEAAISFNEKHRDLRGIFLLAPHPLKTRKYYMALALGIPCISPKWVHDSVTEAGLRDWRSYLIAAGHSAYLECFTSQVVHPQWALSTDVLRSLPTTSELRRPLKGISFVHQRGAKGKDAADAIQFILRAMGASQVELVDKLSDASRSPASYDYVVLEDGVKVPAGVHGARVVDVAWVKQSLLMGRSLTPQLCAVWANEA